MRKKINEYKYILASGSPRRKELLEGLDLNFKVDTSYPVDETIPQGIEVEKIPEYLAKIKSLAYTKDIANDEILITSDTLVLCPITTKNSDFEETYTALGKPKDKIEAIKMLKMLSGKTHKVLSGVCIRGIKTDSKEIFIHTFTSTSEVSFKELNLDEIEYYIDKYKPYDKAGAYAIQEWIGYIGITEIKGSYFNIVGLPVQKLYTELEKYCQEK